MSRAKNEGLTEKLCRYDELDGVIRYVYPFREMSVTGNSLQTWQRQRLEFLREQVPPKEGLASVTVLAYHFWDQPQFDTQFDFLECAIREAWRHCGFLKTVLVVNRVTPRLETFAALANGHVKLDVCEDLVPDRIYTMSVDCNANLHRRFDTAYVLIVQNDGFPIRSGLEKYVGPWDFIGAPYVRNTWRNRLFCNMFGCWVSNGGFSLRSKKICELASYYWNKKYFKWSDSRAVSEDIFYTETLPLRERSYRKSVRIADYAHSVAFSYDAAFPYAGTVPPFGFHGLKAFDALRLTGCFSE